MIEKVCKRFVDLMDDYSSAIATCFYGISHALIAMSLLLKGEEDRSQFLSGVLVVSITYCVLFTVGISAARKRSRNFAEAIKSNLDMLCDGNSAEKLLFRPELYEEMHKSASLIAADSRYRGVYMAMMLTSYMEFHPNRDDKEVKEYHDLVDTIIDEDRLNVVRIVAICTTSKLEWILQQIDKFGNKDRYSLYLDNIHSIGGQRYRSRPITNVQIYGECDIYYFRTNKKYDLRPKNNLKVISKYQVEIMSQEYEELREKCSENWIILEGAVKPNVLDPIIEELEKKSPREIQAIKSKGYKYFSIQ